MRHSSCDECGVDVIRADGCDFEVDNTEVEHKCNPHYLMALRLHVLDLPAQRDAGQAR